MNVELGILTVMSILRENGVRVVEVPGWRTRGSGSFAAMRGQVNHHDAVPASAGHAGGLRVCTFGRPDLRNSLCMFYLGSDGTVYVVAARVSWHAGTSEWRKEKRGNYVFSGIEARNNGTGEAWPAVQLRAYEILNAACAEVWGYGSEWVADHKEVALPRGRKTDRFGIDPAAWRARVKNRTQRLQKGDKPTPRPPAQDEEEDVRGAFLSPLDGPQKGLVYYAWVAPDGPRRRYVGSDALRHHLVKLGHAFSADVVGVPSEVANFYVEVGNQAGT